MACARRGPVRAGSPPWARSLRRVGLRRLTPLLADQRLLACIFDRLAHAADDGYTFVILERAGQRHRGPQRTGRRHSTQLLTLPRPDQPRGHAPPTIRAVGYIEPQHL